MGDNVNQMNQVRELLFGEQFHTIEARLKELADQFDRELKEAKAEIQAKYDEKIAAMKKTFTESDKYINDNMVTRKELASFLSDIVSKLNG